MISQAPLVIIGMHRSGTTMLTQVLERAGVMMGHDFTAYHESNFFQRCNVDLLKRYNASWDKPVVTQGAPTHFQKRQLLTEYASLRKRPLGWWPMLYAKRWGWKDPRTTFTLSSWLKVFPDLYAVHICRNGLDVSRSLYERNSMLQPESKWHSPLLNDLNTCFDLWETYVRQAILWKQELGKRYLMVRYEDLIAQRPDSIQQLENFCERKVRNALKHEVSHERHLKEPIADIDALRERARTNQTFLRLGYAV